MKVSGMLRPILSVSTARGVAGGRLFRGFHARGEGFGARGAWFALPGRAATGTDRGKPRGHEQQGLISVLKVG